VGGAAGGLALVGGALARRRSRRRWTAGLPADPELAELELALRRTGRPPDPVTTLASLERRLAHAPEAAAYVRALARRRFGPGGPAPDGAQRRALRRALGDGLGLRGQLRAWLALPPRPRAAARARR
jgi:hypothetical protein